MTTGKKAQRNTRSYERRNPAARAKDLERGEIEVRLKQGKLKKPAACPKCGRKPPEVRIEWDHDTKPQGWSCSRCNKRGRAVKKKRKPTRKAPRVSKK